mmetsp:Transcript_21811/g.66214  ORF Transcript_21811/g.66214 Transcript_21811/m.66214 type:complete len:95 (-) Transcript_21811:981-1265(-)
MEARGNSPRIVRHGRCAYLRSARATVGQKQSSGCWRASAAPLHGGVTMINDESQPSAAHTPLLMLLCPPHELYSPLSASGQESKQERAIQSMQR